MMASLFSMFDPSTPSFYQTNWITALAVFLLMPMKIWTNSSPLQAMTKKVFSTMSKEFSVITYKAPPFALCAVSALIYLACINLLSLAPYNFAPTSHTTMTMALSIPLWLAPLMLALTKNTSKTIAHTVPADTPIPLMPFMVVIESVSLIIRPLTLTIRLAANMTSGHLLVALLNSVIPPFATIPATLAAQVLLGLLETAVACIQAYVFAILITMYAAETN